MAPETNRAQTRQGCFASEEEPTGRSNLLRALSAGEPPLGENAEPFRGEPSWADGLGLANGAFLRPPKGAKNICQRSYPFKAGHIRATDYRQERSVAENA